MKKARLISLLLLVCFLLATVAVYAAPYYRLGEKIEVMWKGKWYPATVTRVVSSHRYKIHYNGYSSSWDEYVSPSRMRKSHHNHNGGGSGYGNGYDTRYRVGQQVLVSWHGKWYPATILSRTGDGRYRIHYRGYSSSWDEYVYPSRIKPYSSGGGYNDNYHGSTSGQSRYYAGQQVLVSWHGKWYRAKIMRVLPGGRYKIHYNGYSSSWDEVVGANRIRVR